MSRCCNGHKNTQDTTPEGVYDEGDCPSGYPADPGRFRLGCLWADSALGMEWPG